MKWAEEYAPVHAVAHWEDSKQKPAKRYQDKLEGAAESAEQLLAGCQALARKLLDSYPTVIWEDQDECLEVRPEDILK